MTTFDKRRAQEAADTSICRLVTSRPDKNPKTYTTGPGRRSRSPSPKRSSWSDRTRTPSPPRHTTDQPSQPLRDVQNFRPQELWQNPQFLPGTNIIRPRLPPHNADENGFFRGNRGYQDGTQLCNWCNFPGHIQRHCRNRLRGLPRATARALQQPQQRRQQPDPTGFPANPAQGNGEERQ